MNWIAESSMTAKPLFRRPLREARSGVLLTGRMSGSVVVMGTVIEGTVDIMVEIGMVMRVAVGQLGRGSNPVTNTDYRLARRLPRNPPVVGMRLRISLVLLIESEIGRREPAAVPADWTLTLISLAIAAGGMSCRQEKIVPVRIVPARIVEEGMTERIGDMIGIAPEPV